ncbi:MAG: ATP-binding cassette domain-containing protein [Acidimicrobiales bacterium]
MTATFGPDRRRSRDERGDKIMIGPNGAGSRPSSRRSSATSTRSDGAVKIGANVDIAYFAQHQVDALDLDKTVEQEFRHKVGATQATQSSHRCSGSFGLGGAVDRRVGELSGGERTRLALAETMCNPVNLLVLDEPTNHLDLPSCDVLEDAHNTYPGTVLLVSHDRHLIRNVVEAVVEVKRQGHAVSRRRRNTSSNPAQPVQGTKPPGRRRRGQPSARQPTSARRIAASPPRIVRPRAGPRVSCASGWSASSARPSEPKTWQAGWPTSSPIPRCTTTANGSSS